MGEANPAYENGHELPATSAEASRLSRHAPMIRRSGPAYASTPHCNAVSQGKMSGHDRADALTAVGPM
jgi:hypothetical protein